MLNHINWDSVLHFVLFFGGAGGFSWLSYAANEFPVPDGKYGRWFLKIVQKALNNQPKVAEIEAAVKATEALASQEKKNA